MTKNHVMGIENKSKDGNWDNIKRNEYRFRRARRPLKFTQIDYPKLLKECELLTQDFKFGYCQIKQQYVFKEEILK